MRAALALLLAACGDGGGGGNPPLADAAPPVDIPGDAMPREVITEHVSLVVNEVVEAIMTGGAEDFARIKIEAGGQPFDWNLHSHIDGATQVVTQELGVDGVDFAFVPPADAEWFILIRDQGPVNIEVDLTVELFGNMTWQGFQ